MEVKAVPKNVIAVKVSGRKYRIGILRDEGNGMSHFNSQPWGLTGIVKYELTDETLDFQQLHDRLAEYAATEPSQDWSPYAHRTIHKS